MTKNVFVISTFLCGVALCVFGNSAFAAIGVILGGAGIAWGVYLIGWNRSYRRESILGGAALIVVGLVAIILCLFVAAVAFFLGGIILAATGIILLLVFGRRERLITPLCIGCLVAAVLMLFMPSLIGWLTVAVGIGLLLYSGAALVYMY